MSGGSRKRRGDGSDDSQPKNGLISQKTSGKGSGSENEKGKPVQRGRGRPSKRLRSASAGTSGSGSEPSPVEDTTTTSTTTTDISDLKVDLKHGKLRNCTVSLQRIGVNNIQVSTIAKNKREVCYIGIDESNSRSVERYVDWRSEQFIALPSRKHLESGKGKAESPAKEKENTTLIPISRECNAVFSISTFKDDMHSIMDVLTGQKMSTMVLDAFLTLRIMSHNANANSATPNKPVKPSNVSSFEYLSVHFLPVFDENRSVSTLEPNMNLAPPPDSLKNCILIAPQYLCKHYYLAVFNFPSKSIYIYDSSWSYVPMYPRFHQVRKVLKSLTGFELGKDNQSWDIFYVEKCAQQQDEVNCGCFVVYFTENELKGKSYKNEIKINNGHLLQIRQEIVREILPSTNIGTQILNAISM